MEILNLSTNSNSHYHTLKTISEKKANGFMVGVKQITGFHLGEINIDDIVEFVHKDPVKYKVLEVIERRHHKGIFNDPSSNKDSFFKINVSFELRIV